MANRHYTSFALPAATRWLAGLCLFVLLAGCKPESPVETNPLEAATTYLWSMQEEDGSWRSQQYRVLATGEVLTPFILHTLGELNGGFPPDHRDDAALGLDFLRSQIDTAGAIGRSDPFILAYPNYATAYALRSLARAGQQDDEGAIAAMRYYLIQQQFTEHRAIASGHPAYGSWGFGETSLPEGQVGHADLSHTRRVLQALSESGGIPDSIMTAARMGLASMQNGPTTTIGDGGFYYSSVVWGANKGGGSHEGSSPAFNSYATATADGLLALVALESSFDDARFRGAADWLKLHARLDVPEGIPAGLPGQWREAMFFYHLAVRAEAYRHIGGPAGWQQDLMAMLEAVQSTDGSFQNPYGASNKEDDPLLATALAVIALHHAEQSIQS